MATIRILSDSAVNQIAAGEVIERPAAVVKELVENSLDAGAKTITVALLDGGKGRVRVADDGHGMDEQDALMCIERHATSKIRSPTDLLEVRTMGFRGEALPSIASVSQFELSTKRPEDELGTRIRIDSGVLTDVRPVATVDGTTIEVKGLFKALPVRRGFMRTKGTELAHCQQAVIRSALGRPDVDFTLRHEGREILRCPAATWRERCRQILGGDALKFVEIDVVRHGMRLVGFASPPGINRSTTTTSLYLFVNRRFVRDVILRRAVLDAYRELVPRGRYPLVVLDLQVDTRRVDVNVHPTKTEVRFDDPRGLSTALAGALRTAVLQGAPDPVRPVAQTVQVASLPFTAAHPADDPRFTGSGDSREVPATPKPEPTPQPAQPVEASQALHAAEPDSISGKERLFRGFEPLGVVEGRFLFARRAGGHLIDLGGLAGAIAAKQAGIREPKRLLVPVRLSLSASEDRAALEHAEILESLGLVARQMASRDWAVRAVPHSFPSRDPAELLRQAAGAVGQGAAAVRKVWAAGGLPIDEEDDFAWRRILATADELGFSPEPWTRPIDGSSLFGLL